jgi:hypothetical protein
MKNQSYLETIKYIPYHFWITSISVKTRACERSGSGAENGAERAEKLVSGTSEKNRGAERSAEREIGERERSVERAISSHKFP